MPKQSDTPNWADVARDVGVYQDPDDSDPSDDGDDGSGGISVTISLGPQAKVKSQKRALGIVGADQSPFDNKSYDSSISDESANYIKD